MYARVANIIAQNKLQLTMWIETFKAIKMNVLPNKETADKAKKAVSEKIKKEREMMKLEISEGEVVFSQNSLAHE